MKIRHEPRRITLCVFLMTVVIYTSLTAISAYVYLTSRDLFSKALKLYASDVTLVSHASEEVCLNKIYSNYGSNTILMIVDPPSEFLVRAMQLLPSRLPIVVFGDSSTCNVLGLSCIDEHNVELYVGGVKRDTASNVVPFVVELHWTRATVSLTSLRRVSSLLAFALNERGDLFPLAFEINVRGRPLVFAPKDLLDTLLLSTSRKLPIAISSWIELLSEHALPTRSSFSYTNGRGIEVKVIVCDFREVGSSFGHYRKLTDELIQYISLSLNNLANSILTLIKETLSKVFTSSMEISVTDTMEYRYCDSIFHSMPSFNIRERGDTVCLGYFTLIFLIYLGSSLRASTY